MTIFFSLKQGVAANGIGNNALLFYYRTANTISISKCLTFDRLIETEGQDLFIECIAVGGQPAPTLSLVVLGTTVQTGVQELRYVLQKIPRIYDTTNISCVANSEALDIGKTTTALIFLSRKYHYISITDCLNMFNQC